MFTIDRLNALRRYYGYIYDLHPVAITMTTLKLRYPAHHHLDVLDRCAGLETAGAFVNGRKAYVGDRLALHEAFLAQKLTTPAPDGNYDHWLGRETMLEQPLTAQPSALMRDAVTVRCDYLSHDTGDCSCYN